MPQFIYPYNFVPCEDAPRKRAPFKPLHRFSGLTGRIEYTMKNLSPLFIPDPEGTTAYKIGQGEEDVHRVMDFFNVEKRLCLPPTSIKGMVRNVVEAATNSSFGVFNAAETKQSYRKTTGFNNFCGVYNSGTITPYTMVKLPYAFFVNAARSVLSLPSAAPVPTFDELKNNFDKTSINNVQCWKIHTGMEVVVEFTMGGTSYSLLTGPVSAPMTGVFMQRPRSPHAKRMIVMSGVNYNCPTERDVGIGPNPVGKGVTFIYAPLGAGLGNRVVNIQRTHNGTTYTWDGRRTTPRNCRLWVHLGKSGRYIYVIHTPTATIPVSNPMVLDNYKTVNGNKPLEDDQIVFFRKDGRGRNITEIGPVAMFKSAENASLADIVGHSNIKYPSTADSLCHATRLFGWTPQNKSAQEQGVAGRVRFSVAWSDKKLDDTELVPLKILGGPKHKYYPFYLKPADGTNDKAAYYSTTIDDWSQTPGKIRGRKFYLHHPSACMNDLEAQYAHVRYDHTTETEIQQQLYQYCRNELSFQQGNPVVSRENDKYLLMYRGVMSAEVRSSLFSRSSRDDYRQAIQVLYEESGISNQNVTSAVLPAPAEFKGYIEFESLDPHELGMLLWCLTLSDDPMNSSPDHAHKLGKGKGIGMGSVQFMITDISLHDPAQNWFDINGSEPVELERRHSDSHNWSDYIKKFKAWLIERGPDDSNPDKDFENKPFIRDLLLILRKDLAGDMPVAYHPDTIPPDEGFRYFMEQRKKRFFRQAGADRHNKEQPLRTPSEIKNRTYQDG